MNKAYRLIWSQARNAWVVAAEIVRAQGLPAVLAAVVVSVMAGAGTELHALPSSPVVVSGQAAVATAGSTLTVTSSDRAVINWNSFSISSGETARFIQPTSMSSVLNRVTSSTPSAIYGTLQSNGRVFLVNQNGIFIGPGATIDTRSFIASTLDIRDSDFITGRMIFNAGPVAGRIDNQGVIRTPGGGRIWLIAPDIANSGIINAPDGGIMLAAGRQVSLVDSSDPDLAVVVSAPESQALNLGSIIAEAGRVGIYGGLVKQRGTVSASSAVTDGGRIFFKATRAVDLAAGSVTAADGVRGGTVIATTEDNGRPSGELTARGSVSARGNGTRGSGGFVETSADRVDLNGVAVDTGGGTWLIDPTTIYIADTLETAAAGGMTGTDTSAETGSGTAAGTAQDSFISTGTIESALVTNNVTVTTANPSGTGAGDISVLSPVTWSSGSNLSLVADNSIMINRPVSGSNGTLTLSGRTIVNSSSVSVASALFAADTMDLGGGSINAGTGRVTLKGMSAGRAIDIGMENADALSLTAGELGTISAGVLQIGDSGESGPVTVSAPVDLFAHVSALGLESSSAISQMPGATISARSLYLKSAGDVLLPEANPVGVVAGSFGGTGFTYRSSNLLTVAVVDAVQGISATGGGTITLGTDSSAGIDQQAGAPLTTFGGLSLLSSNGPVNLTSKDNSIGTIAASAPEVSFVNSRTLTVGTVDSASGITASGAVTLTASGGPDGDGIHVDAPVSTEFGDISLQGTGVSGGNYNYGSRHGVIINSQVSTSSGGNISITGSGGDGSTYMGYYATSGGNGVVLSPGSYISTGSAVGDISAGARGTISITGTGGRGYDGGSTMAGSAGGHGVVMNGFYGAPVTLATNAVVTGTVSGSAAIGTVSVTGTGGAGGNSAFSIGGDGGSGIMAGSSGTTAIVNTAAEGGGTIGGAIGNETAVGGTLAISAAAAVNGGSIAGGTTGAVVLNGTGAAGGAGVTGTGAYGAGVSAAGDIIARDLSVTAVGGISVTAAVSRATLVNNVSGNISLISSAAALALGPVSNSSGDVSVSAAGSISQEPEAPVTAKGLTVVSAGGNVTLDNPANTVETVSAQTGGGSFSFTNSTAFSVGTVSGTGGITTSLDGVGGNDITLKAAGGGIGQSAPIVAGTGHLSLTSSGPVILDNPSNSSGSISGSVTGPGAGFSYQDSGTVTISGSGIAAAGDVMLAAGGGITQTPGASIAALSLQLSAAGDVVLAEANPVGVVAGSFGGTLFRYASGNQLTVAARGTYNGISALNSGTISLESPVGINQQAGAAVTTAGGLSLMSSGHVVLTEAGNHVAMLTADAAGIDFSTDGNLTVGSYDGLDGISSTGPVIVKSRGALSVAAPVTSGSSDLVFVGDGIATVRNGSIHGGNVMLAATAAGGLTTIGADVSAGHSIGISTDNLAVAGGALNAPFGQIGITTATGGRPLTVGEPACAGGIDCLLIPAAGQTLFNSPLLVLGSDGKSGPPGAAYSYSPAGDIYIGGGNGIDRTMSGDLMLLSGGGITQSPAAVITAASLTASAVNGPVSLNTGIVPHTVSRLSGSSGGDFAVSTAGQVDIGSTGIYAAGAVTVDSGSDLSIPAPVHGEQGVTLRSGGNAVLSAAVTSGGDMTIAARAVTIINAPVTAGADMQISATGDIILDATRPGGMAILASGGQSQAVFSESGLIRLLGGAGGAADIRYFGTGSQTVTGSGVELSGGIPAAGGSVPSYGPATIESAGDQSIITSGILTLQAGKDGNDNPAAIRAFGSQTISAGSILLAGGGSGGSYNNYAEIVHGSDGAGTQTTGRGGQSFVLTAPEAQLVMTGGSGNGISGNYDTACGIACQGFGSGSGAAVRNTSGSQTFDFLQGGAIVLTGGAGGNGNGVSIGNEAATLQEIYSSSSLPPSIYLSGGIGGVLLAGPDGAYSMDNGASISSRGVQMIVADRIAMTGGSGPSSRAGVYLGAPSTNITARSLSMKGGDGVIDSLVSPNGGTYSGTDLFASPAAIGDTAATDITLNIGSGGFEAIGGSIGMYGGSAVMMGSVTGNPAISLIVNGDSSLSGSAGSLRFGSIGSSGGTFDFKVSGGLDLKTTLSLAAGQRLAVDGVLSGQGGGISLSGGALTINGAATLASLAVSGGQIDGIGSLAVTDSFSGAGGAITGISDLALHHTAGSLELGTRVDVTGSAVLYGEYDVVLNAPVTAGGDITAVTAGRFVNNAGPEALASSGGRWLVWSGNPANDSRGGLVYDFKQYNAVYGATAVAGSGSGFLYSIAPVLTATLAGSVIKEYDGTTAAVLTSGNYLPLNSIDGDVVTLGSHLNGTYDTKNAATDKLITVNGLTAAAVSSADDGSVPVYGYSLSSTATGSIGTITPKTLIVTGTQAEGKPYDGTTAATVSGGTISPVRGDSVTLVQSGFFVDRNAGTGRNVSYSNSLTGADAGNYLLDVTAGTVTADIAVRELSTWSGTHSSLWSDPANWDAVPDLANVRAVSIPAGSGQVIYDASAGSTSLQSITSLRNLAITGGSLTVSGALTTTGYQQSGGGLYGAGNLNVTESFSQTGGTVALTGTAVAALYQAGGNLTLANISAPEIRLEAPTGAITQTGPLETGILRTVSAAGTVLKDTGNRFAGYAGYNSATGDIELHNGVPVTIAAMVNAGGGFIIDNIGAVTTGEARLSAAGVLKMTAHSPLAVGSGGISAASDIVLEASPTGAGSTSDNLTIDGPVDAGGDILLKAGGAIIENAAITAQGTVSRVQYLNTTPSCSGGLAWNGSTCVSSPSEPVESPLITAVNTALVQVPVSTITTDTAPLPGKSVEMAVLPPAGSPDEEQERSGGTQGTSEETGGGTGLSGSGGQGGGSARPSRNYCN